MVTDRITLEKECYTEGTVHVVRVPAKLLPAFQQLVSRGINTWDQAPQEIKDFADELSGNNKLLGMKVVVNPVLAPNEFRLVKNCVRAPMANCYYPHCNCPRN